MTARCPDFAEILRNTDPDRATLDQIVECFYDELGRTARRLCRDPVLAEDAAQEAMTVGLKALQGYRGDAPLLHWLRRLVVSSCSRLRRGRKNNPRLHEPFLRDDGEHPASAEQAPQEMEVLLGERLALLSEVLAEVPEPNRSLLLRHEGQDESLQDLAAEYALSVEAVKARLKRTRATVRSRVLALAEGAA